MDIPKIIPSWLENFHVTVMDIDELLIFDSWNCPIRDLVFKQGHLAKGGTILIKGNAFTVKDIVIAGNGFEPEPYGKHNIQLVIYTIEGLSEDIYENFDDILFDQ
ncbi:MAG: hypothetical protein K1X49_10285 [Saprospiraceae bacterium]|nr:hypothetical protein [Saprospiraceae bacterium]